MNKAIDLSNDNVSVRWKHVKRNLLDMGIGSVDKFETDAHRAIQGILQRGIDAEFSTFIKASKYERNKMRLT